MQDILTPFVGETYAIRADTTESVWLTLESGQRLYLSIPAIRRIAGIVVKVTAVESSRSGITLHCRIMRPHLRHYSGLVVTMRLPNFRRLTGWDS